MKSEKRIVVTFVSAKKGVEIVVLGDWSTRELQAVHNLIVKKAKRVKLETRQAAARERVAEENKKEE